MFCCFMHGPYGFVTAVQSETSPFLGNHKLNSLSVQPSSHCVRAEVALKCEGFVFFFFNAAKNPSKKSNTIAPSIHVEEDFWKTRKFQHHKSAQRNQLAKITLKARGRIFVGVLRCVQARRAYWAHHRFLGKSEEKQQMS